MGEIAEAIKKYMADNNKTQSALINTGLTNGTTLHSWLHDGVPGDSGCEAIARMIKRPIMDVKRMASRDKLALMHGVIKEQAIRPADSKDEPELVIDTEPKKRGPKPNDDTIPEPKVKAPVSEHSEPADKPKKRAYHRREQPVKADVNSEQATDSNEYLRLKECLKVIQDDADLALDCLIGAIEMRNFDAIKTYANIAWARNIAVKAIKKSLEG